jgi:hypothetical protein
MFRPTALLVQTHNVTGLKYFCKTIHLDKVHWYKGSGTVWKRHLKKHGNDVSTGIMGVYYDRQRCVESALEFSRKHNIVASKEWANLVEENAETGAQGGDKHPMFGRPHPQKGTKRPEISARMSGQNNPNYGIKWSEERKIATSIARTGKKLNRPLGSKSGMKGKAYPEEGKRKLSEVMKGNKFSLGKFPSEETKAKMSASQKARAASFAVHPNAGRKHSEETKAKMRAARANRIYTDEDKQKISEAVTAWHKQRKEQS